MIAAHAYAGAGMNGGAALANENVPGNDGLAPRLLKAEPAAGGVAAVA